MGKYVCRENACAGCMACVSKCPKNAIFIQDNLDSYNAVIDERLCVDCGTCFKVCQINNPPTFCDTMEWFQGWANDTAIRARSSSGGAATAILKHFVQIGGIVCSCKFKDGEFSFAFADNINSIEDFSGSKYVKSSPKDVYSEIRRYIKNGKNVLFLGLPCQVAAVKNFIDSSLRDHLVLVELICHGTPSPQVLELFLKDHKMCLGDLQNIKFRVKTNFFVSCNSNNSMQSIAPKGSSDLYSTLFLKGTTYTENCYSCRYAQTSRCADVTLGDSWGSSLSVDEKRQGISLIMCQTEKGIRLVKASDLHLEEVDKDKAIAANRQLRAPSVAPPERKQFFHILKTKQSFLRACSRVYPREFTKYKIKALLSKMRIARGGDM